MVSIIVPVYNVEGYLDKCINSIVNQTFRDIEIILIDDGSTDNSGDICLRWQERDNRILYIRKKNEGLGPTRNLGVSIAKGEYIKFVDSDDWIEEDAVELMYNAARKSNADIVLSDINFIIRDGDGKLNTSISRLRIECNKAVYSKEDISLIDKARVYAWGKLYKKKFYEKCKVSQPAHAFEDGAVVPLLIAKSDIIYRVPKALYNYYRNRPESIVNSNKYTKDLVKSLEEAKKGFEENKLFDKYYDALSKIAFSQIKFLYRKVLGDNEELDSENRVIIAELYEFMDINYPDWIKFDESTVGVVGNENLRKAVKNIVFNVNKIKFFNGVEGVYNQDIVLIDLVDKLFYENIEQWKSECERNVKFLKKYQGRQKVIIFKFINAELTKREKNIMNDVYNFYKKENHNIKVLEFLLNKEENYENEIWDLSDEILIMLKDNKGEKRYERSYK